MRYLIVILLMLFGAEVLAQATPSGYTGFLRLRKYAAGADASADSINANADDIDAGVRVLDDTLTVVKADLYNVVTYAGALKPAVVTNVSLSTEVDTGRVKTTGNDNIYGVKTLHNTWNTEFLLPRINSVYWNGNAAVRWKVVFSKYMYSDYFVVTNTSDITDTAIISYDGTTVSIDKPLSVGGITITAQTLGATNAAVPDTNVISAGSIYIDVSTNLAQDVNDFILLPAIASVSVGYTITIVANSNGNFELRTPASSQTKINNVDADGTNEYLVTDATTVYITKVSNTYGWEAHDFDHVGAIVAAHVPN